MDPLRKKYRNLGITDSLSIVYSARKGVRPSVFYSFAEGIKMSEKALATILHMHPRTISNYQEQKKSLSPVESEHLLKLISLFARGEEIFGTIDGFNQWLDKPYLDSKQTAMEWLDTPGGVDMVAEEVERLAHAYVV